MGNESVLIGMKLTIAPQVPSRYPAVCGIQREAKKYILYYIQYTNTGCHGAAAQYLIVNTIGVSSIPTLREINCKHDSSKNKVL